MAKQIYQVLANQQVAIGDVIHELENKIVRISGLSSVSKKPMFNSYKVFRLCKNSVDGSLLSVLASPCAPDGSNVDDSRFTEFITDYHLDYSYWGKSKVVLLEGHTKRFRVDLLNASMVLQFYEAALLNATKEEAAQAE